MPFLDVLIIDCLLRLFSRFRRSQPPPATLTRVAGGGDLILCSYRLFKSGILLIKIPIKLVGSVKPGFT